MSTLVIRYLHVTLVYENTYLVIYHDNDTNQDNFVMINSSFDELQVNYGRSSMIELDLLKYYLEQSIVIRSNKTRFASVSNALNC